MSDPRPWVGTSTKLIRPCALVAGAPRHCTFGPGIEGRVDSETRDALMRQGVPIVWSYDPRPDELW